MHDAELDSAIASIWIFPPGQVTETSFSPGPQMSSHLVLHAGWKSACRLCTPAGPAGPGGPGGPSGPTPPPAPLGPAGPAGPGGPGGPRWAWRTRASARWSGWTCWTGWSGRPLWSLRTFKAAGHREAEHKCDNGDRKTHRDSSSPRTLFPPKSLSDPTTCSASYKFAIPSALCQSQSPAPLCYAL
jgi:hypothetical protein